MEIGSGMTAFINRGRAWFQGRISFRWDLYLMRNSIQPKLLLDIGTASENELLDGRVGKLLRDVMRYTTFILDILAQEDS